MYNVCKTLKVSPACCGGLVTGPGTCAGVFEVEFLISVLGGCSVISRLN